MRCPTLAAFVSISLFAAGKPEDELAGSVKTFLGKSFVNEWSGIETVRKITWAPLPPHALTNCLPDGGCFTRQGAALFGDRKLAVFATGAREIVSNIYLRNQSAPLGEAAVLAALKEAGLSSQLARCPMQEGVGGTNWYKLTGAAANPGVLSIQTACTGKPCEGFVLTLGAGLPPLQPNQLRLYTEQCSVAPSDRKPVSTSLPHEQLAQTLAALVPASTGPALYDWKTVVALPTGIKWPAGPAPKGGSLDLSGRQFNSR